MQRCQNWQDPLREESSLGTCGTFRELQVNQLDQTYVNYKQSLAELIFQRLREARKNFYPIYKLNAMLQCGANILSPEDYEVFVTIKKKLVLTGLLLADNVKSGTQSERSDLRPPAQLAPRWTFDQQRAEMANQKKDSHPSFPLQYLGTIRFGV
jgi:hypothetical protein